MRVTIVLFMLLGLTGCNLSVKKPEPEVRYYEVPYNVPGVLTDRCKVTRPISREAYMSYSLIEREGYLTEYTITLLNDIKLCDLKLQKVKEFIAKKNANLTKPD